MKRLIILAVLLSLVMSGCMARTVAKNVLAGTNKVLCDPTVDQVVEAVQAISFLQSAGDANAAINAALEVFQRIKDRVCVTIPELEMALEIFDATSPPLKIIRIAEPKPSLSALRAAAGR